MAVHNYTAGIGHVGSFQVSGIPWMSGSKIPAGGEQQYSFPSVAKSITVVQSGSGEPRVHFVSKNSMTKNLDGGSYFQMSADKDSLTMNVKCKHIYVSNPGSSDTGVQVFAELTRIASGYMFELTGSGISE